MKTEQIPHEEQLDIDFETPEQKRKRLTESVKEARKNHRDFTSEESDFIDEQAREDRVDMERTYR